MPLHRSATLLAIVVWLIRKRWNAQTKSRLRPGIVDFDYRVFTIDETWQTIRGHQ